MKQKKCKLCQRNNALRGRCYCENCNIKVFNATINLISPPESHQGPPQGGFLVDKIKDCDRVLSIYNSANPQGFTRDGVGIGTAATQLYSVVYLV